MTLTQATNRACRSTDPRRAKRLANTLVREMHKASSTGVGGSVKGRSLRVASIISRRMLGSRLTFAEVAA